MGALKKTANWLVVSILSLLLFSMVFSLFSEVSPERMINGMFNDLYDYSNDKTKQDISLRLDEACKGFIESEEKNAESKGMIDKVKNACNDYKNNKIGKKELFVAIMSSAADTGNISKDKNNPLAKLSDLSKKFDEFILSIYSLIIVAVLAALLVLLNMKEPLEFLKIIGKIFFNIGLLIIVPFLILKIYVAFANIDTSSIAGPMFNPENAQPDIGNAMMMLLPLVFLRVYTTALVVAGAVLFIAGLGLRIVFWVMKKKKS